MIAAGVSQASRRPWCITAIRSARPVTTSMWCSTISTVFRSSLVHRADQLDELGTFSTETPAIGSSSRITRGSPASTIASSSRRLSPCASEPASTAARPAEARPARAPSRPGRAPRAPRPPDARSGSRRRAGPPRRAARSPATGSSGNTFETWNVRPSPSLRPPVGGRSVTSPPSSRDASGRRPAAPREQVEQRRLAGAVRPDHPEELACGDVERDIGDDGRAADVKPELLCCEDRSHDSRSHVGRRA